MANDLTNKQEAFCVAYIELGVISDAYRRAYNSTAPGQTANTEGRRLLAMPKIKARVAQLRAPALKAAALTVERTIQGVRRICEVDPRRFFRDDGTMVPPSQWDEDMAAAVSFVKAIPVLLKGKRGSKPTIGYTYELKFWDKNAGLDKAMKHLGLFEKDNAQSRESLVLHVEAAKPVKK